MILISTNKRSLFFQIFHSLVILLALCFPLSAGTGFEHQLAAVFRLWKAEKSAELIALLQRIPAGGHLEDVRLFLLGECLKKAGREAEALELFGRIMKQFPDTVGSRRAGLSYILLAAKTQQDTEAFSLLRRLAVSLPTPYQRGRALESLADAMPPSHPQKSELALLSLHSYRGESGSLASAKESTELLKKITGDHTLWSFTPEQWVEVTLAATSEGLGQQVLRLASFLKPALGHHSDALQLIIQADALRALGHRDRALSLLSGLLGTNALGTDLRGLAAQVRGQLFAAMGKNEAAEKDFRVALAWGKPPVDVDLVRLRFVRAAYSMGHDRLAFEELLKLCQKKPKLALLPGLAYELALKRFDDGFPQASVPFFLLLPEYFAGHYRADDSLGYAAIALGTDSVDGKKLLARIRQRYPHSFFLYWLDKGSRKLALPHGGAGKNTVPNWAARRLPAWRLLLKSDFASWARDEMRQMQDENPLEPGLYHLLMQVAEETGDYNQMTAYGERFLRNLIDAGKSSADMPRWAWQAHYPRPFWGKIITEAEKHGIDPYWVLSIMREESHFNPKTLSRSNAMGLMQILPTTGKWIAEKLGIKGRFNKESLWEPGRNISFGVWYLSYLMKLFNGDLFLAAAAYNGGQGNIQRKVEAGPHAGLPVLERLDRVPLSETRDYYKKVMGSWWNYHRLYEQK